MERTNTSLTAKGVIERFASRIIIGDHRWLTFFLLLIGLLTIHPAVQGYNDGSRMATIQSLVEDHTFAIDNSDFFEGFDKVYIDGHYYSDKPVFTALFGAAVYFPLYHLGITLGPGWNLAYYLITLLTVKLFWFLGVKTFYAILGHLEMGKKDRLLLTVAVALGSLFFSWSATFNNHVLSAGLLLFGLYFLLKVQPEAGNFWNYFLAGLFFALSGVQDFTMMTFYACFALYILFKGPLRGEKLAYLLPLLLTVVPTLWINYAISGSIVPFYLVKEYYLYPEFPLLESNLFVGMELKGGWDLIGHAVEFLFWKKGFLLHNPLTFLAIPLMVVVIIRKGKLWKEALVITFGSLVVIVAYLLTSLDYGGFAYSIRWFVPLLPLWYVFLYPIFTQERPKLRRAFSVLFILSVIIAAVGLIDPWTTDITGVPFLDNLISLILRV